ncbi:MAG: PCMD domain-containing protein [Bacteroidales bacterium]|jgi:hypothetical protein|nr:PCMD domain-containing protein [Bacteroidales bacterium]
MKKIILIISVLSIVFSACVDEKYYKESSKCDIVSFEISGQISNKITIKEDTSLVEVGIPISLSLNNLKINSFEISPLAKSDRDYNSIKDFSSDVFIRIIAEDGITTKLWKIKVFYQDAPLQLAYSDMKKWTIAKDENGAEIKIGNLYAYFPGEENQYSPWQCAARANVLTGFFSVNPKPSVENPLYASMETKTYGLGAMMHSAIVAGALFTGKFIFDQNHLPVIGSDPNPRKMINFGTPFYKKPVGVKFKMRYKAGEIMRDGDNQPIIYPDAQNRPTKDSCEIYFILQNRESDSSKYYRIATAWLRTSEEIGSFDSEDGFVEMQLPFIYGKPDNQTLIEKPYMNIGGVRGELVFYKFSFNGSSYNKTAVEEQYSTDNNMGVDNIIAVFSSSAYGDLFYGAPDSKLDIKDIEFIY